MTRFKHIMPTAAILVVSIFSAAFAYAVDGAKTSGNPIDPEWYADPEVAFFDNQYWIFPTRSLKYDDQTYFDCFSSPDLVNWTKHEKILTNKEIKWARRAMWAPSVVEKDGKYYFFFGANDVHKGEVGGIGVAVADRPEGPYRDYLGKPLVNEIVNGAQPIDQFVFKDDDGTYYLIYGGWRHCNVAKLKDDFTGLLPFEDGSYFREITPRGYVEGPFVFKKDGKYYFMWSEGGWTVSNYQVAYAISDSLFGPHKRIGSLLGTEPGLAKGAGHHSVLRAPSGKWYVVYHRRPIDENEGNYRVTCVDRMEFNEDGTIKPIKMTAEGVEADPAVPTER